MWNDLSISRSPTSSSKWAYMQPNISWIKQHLIQHFLSRLSLKSLVVFNRYLKLFQKSLNNKDFIRNQDRKCWMKCCLIHEMLGCIYAYLVLEVGQRDFNNSFHISHLYIGNVWVVWFVYEMVRKRLHD